MRLAELAWALLDRADAEYRDDPRTAAHLRELRTRIDAPLRLAVVGAAGSGRTTVLDAVVGERVRADRLVVDWPGEVELIDAHAEHCAEADATLFVVPRPGDPGLRALGTGDDVATIVVFARADELGGGRVDALVSARRVARRHARSADLRDRCLDVVAVAGLQALAGATLADDEVALLRGIAEVPREEAEPALLSADRFRGEAFPLPVEPSARSALLDRFGLFGIRLAITLVRRGFTDREALAAQLLRASGIEDLRTAVADCFVDRADALKARSVLSAVAAVARGELAAEVERAWAGAHELRELRLLAALRTGRVSLTGLGEETAHEARCLLGGHGTGPADRLSVDGDAYGALARWRALSLDHGLSDRERRAAAVVARSCEALLVV